MTFGVIAFIMNFIVNKVKKKPGIVYISSRISMHPSELFFMTGILLNHTAIYAVKL